MPHRAALLLIVLAALGCQSQPRPVFVSLDDAPLTDAMGQPRALALDTEALADSGYSADDPDAWFADRADYLPAVSAGYVTPRYFISQTFTRDRFATHNGRVREFSHDTTFRRTIIEGSR